MVILTSSFRLVDFITFDHVWAIYGWAGGLRTTNYLLLTNIILIFELVSMVSANVKFRGKREPPQYCGGIWKCSKWVKFKTCLVVWLFILDEVILTILHMRLDYQRSRFQKVKYQKTRKKQTAWMTPLSRTYLAKFFSSMATYNEGPNTNKET